MRNLSLLILVLVLVLSCSKRVDIPSYKFEVNPKNNLENIQPFYKEGDNKRAILFIHGWTGSPSHLKELALLMNQKGWTVYNIMLTGHGTTLYDMEKATYKDWIKDAEDSYNKLKEKYDRISVVGLSMGGSLALYLASKYKVDRVVCIAPALIPKNKFAYFVLFLRPLLPRFRFRPERIIKEGEAREYLHEYVGSPTKTIIDLIKIGSLTKRSLKNIDSPVLVIQSKKDEAVDPKVPEIIMKKIKSNNKKILWLENSRHISTTDIERDKIYDEIINFLE
ncbi:MAG TPA: alpha/beta fold hydrolase [Spirochaetota bacterium]|nr:alpha/beta fold hydrolase [Spirochaetota bacterium]HOL55961.1 alpha/beta fold hydrolase [Spirochaetota bacterium]HPP03575.1 alpha/beta fold hydrolase [Spirochaetota bacterium]